MESRTGEIADEPTARTTHTGLAEITGDGKDDEAPTENNLPVTAAGADDDNSGLASVKAASASGTMRARTGSNLEDTRQSEGAHASTDAGSSQGTSNDASRKGLARSRTSDNDHASTGAGTPQGVRGNGQEESDSDDSDASRIGGWDDDELLASTYAFGFGASLRLHFVPANPTGGQGDQANQDFQVGDPVFVQSPRHGRNYYHSAFVVEPVNVRMDDGGPGISLRWETSNLPDRVECQYVTKLDGLAGTPRRKKNH